MNLRPLQLIALILMLAFAALASAQQAISAQDATALVKARASYRSGALSQAEEQYRAIIATDPQSALAFAGLARTLLKKDQANDAWDMAKKAVAADAKCADAHAALGETYFRKGFMAEADQEFISAIKIDQATSRAFLGRARISQAYSLYRHARDFIQRAHELDPYDPDITRYWLLNLSPSERETQLEQYLSKPKDDDPVEQKNLRSYLALMQSKQAQPTKHCRLAKPLERTSISLQKLMDGPQRYIGVGLKVEVNGQRSVLQVDTGASGILISPTLAEKAGIKETSRAVLMGAGDQGAVSGYVGYADSIKIGDLEFLDCAVQVTDRKVPIETQGLIGTDIFSKYLVGLDIPDVKMHLSPLPTRPDAPATTPKVSDTDIADLSSITNDSPPQDRYVAPDMKSYDPVFRFGHMLLIRTSVGNASPRLFLIDTGAVTTLISPEAAREVTKVNGDSDTIVKGISGKVDKVFRADQAELHFSHFRQQNQDIIAFDLSGMSRHVGTEISGTLGFSVLSYMKMTIDYRDGLVDFQYVPGVRR